MAKVVHLSSVHRATDVRIFEKECRSLATAGHDVTLIARGPAPVDQHGVHVVTLKTSSGNRAVRMTRTFVEVLRLALHAQGDVYHLHDPELIPLGLLLKLGGKRVIYDAHETLPKHIRTKPWIPAILRHPLAAVAGTVEVTSARMLDGVVAATPGIALRFEQTRCAVVQNYARYEEFAEKNERAYRDRPKNVTYLGGLTKLRGAVEMVEAIDHVADAELVLAGVFEDERLKRTVESLPGWSKTKFLGWLNRGQVAEVLKNSRVALLTLHPAPNYIDSYPIKLFEYMAAGVPVVASNFPFWKQFVEEPGTGLMVDPRNPRQIADAIKWLLTHPEEAEAMGHRGRDAAVKHFTWESEAEKLVKFYSKVYNRTSLGEEQ